MKVGIIDENKYKIRQMPLYVNGYGCGEKRELDVLNKGKKRKRSGRKNKNSYFYVDQNSRNCLGLSQLQKVSECREFTLVLGFRVSLVASILSKGLTS